MKKRVARFAILSRSGLGRRAALTAAAGVALTFGLAWNADAVPAPQLGPTASSFAVLGGTKVANTGQSAVSGNVGVTGTDLAGFPPGQVSNGALHKNDGPAMAAKAELTASFVGPLASAPSTASMSEVGGTTLAPGVYDSGAAMSLNGTVTLDAGGNADALFVFRAVSALDIAQSSHVRLIGKANACNVFWKVGSSATIGHNADFVGTVEALTAITADHDATVHGRLLARNAEITLINDTITAPVNCTPPIGGDGGGGSTPPPTASTSSSPPTASTTSSPLDSTPAGPTTSTSTAPNGSTTPRTVSHSNRTTTTTTTTALTPPLARTGSPNRQLLGLACVLILTGLGTLLLAKRRRYLPRH